MFFIIAKKRLNDDANQDKCRDAQQHAACIGFFVLVAVTGPGQAVLVSLIAVHCATVGHGMVVREEHRSIRLKRFLASEESL